MPSNAAVHSLASFVVMEESFVVMEESFVVMEESALAYIHCPYSERQSVGQPHSLPSIKELIAAVQTAALLYPLIIIVITYTPFHEPFLHTYIHTYIHIHTHTYIRTYIHKYLLEYIKKMF